MNLDFLERSPFSQNYLITLSRNCFSQMILTPARVTENTSTRIDQLKHNGMFHTITGGVIKSAIIGQYCTYLPFRDKIASESERLTKF